MSRPIMFAVILGLVLAFAIPSLSRAEAEFSHIGGALWTQTSHVAVSGSFAFCAVPYGICVFDISDPTAADLVTELYLPGAIDLVISGDYAYVARGNDEAMDTSMLGLAVLDISDPAQPIIIGRCSNGHKVKGIAVSGNYVFLACISHADIVLVDVSDPSSPVEVWQEVTPGSCRDVTVSGDYLYVCDVFGMPIYDISDIYNPVLIGEYTGLEQSLRITVAGDYAYLADVTTGLEIIDVSDPTDPRHAASYRALGTAFVYNVAVQGATAYLSLHTTDHLPWYTYFDILDVSDPSAPALLGRHQLLNTARPGLAVAGNLVFLADSDYLRTIDVSDPGAPAQTGASRLSGLLWKVKHSGEHAYVACNGALVVLDISGPDPVIVGSYPVVSGWDVDLQDNLAVVAGHLAGVIILDITDPTTPSELASFDTPGAAKSVTISGNLLYVADDASLLIYDISSPSAPIQLADVPMPGMAIYVEISGDYAYVSDLETEVQIVDISDPGSAGIVGTVSGLPAWVDRMQIVENYCYLIAGSSLYILDLSNPTAPVQVASLFLGETPSDIVIHGNHAFLAEYFRGVSIINIANPYNPRLVGSWLTPGHCVGVSVDDNRIYLSDRYGFEVVSYNIPVNCGDANGDAQVNIGDAVRMIDYVFRNGDAPQPVCSGDANGDGNGDVGDAVYLINYIFKNGPAPVEGCCP